MKRTHRFRALRFNRSDLYELFICLLLAGLFVMLSSGAAFGQGNVGINNATPHAKSLLDLTSNDKGLLAPRMTAAQRNSMFPVADATAKGMLVYQTDGVQGFYYYDGASWVMVQSGGAGWSLTGNAGTTPAANFVGTTDDQSLAIRTNNAERMRVASNGNVSIGAAVDPVNYRLSVENNSIWPALYTRNMAAGGYSGAHIMNDLGNVRAHIGVGNSASPSWTNMGYAGTTSAHPFILTTSDLERLRIDAAGNVGIGTTTPGRKLDVVDAGLGLAARFQGTNPAGYSIVHWLRSDNVGAHVGFFNPGLGGPLAGNFVMGSFGNAPVSVTTNDTERMHITSTGDIGIGTSAPVSKLQVSRQAAGYAPNPSSAMTVEGSGPVYSSILSSNSETGLLFGAGNDPQNGGIIYNGGSIGNGMQFRTGGNATRMVINSNGAVTVGHNVSWPTYPFGVIAANASSAAVGIRNLDDSGIGGVHYFGSGGSLGGVTGWNNAGNPIAPNSLVHGTLANMPATFITNTAERMRIAANGNVGIGTTNPGAKFHIEGSVANWGLGLVRNMDPAGWSGVEFRNHLNDAASFIGFNNSSGHGYAGTPSNHPFRIFTSGSARVTVAADGNVGIGTATPTTKLEVNGFTKLGTDAPAIKVKKLTGTTAAAEGGTSGIAHGLTAAKIIGVQVLIEYSAGNWVPNGYTINPEYQVDYVVGATNVTLYNQSTNSGNVLSKPVKILVTYEE